MNGGIRGHSDEKNCHQYSKVSPNLKAYFLHTEIVMGIGESMQMLGQRDNLG